MNTSSVWSVLKWILVVLAAGFVGQFGRVIAMRLIERRRGKKAACNNSVRTTQPSELLVEQERIKALAMLEKKRAKAEGEGSKEGRKRLTRA